MIRLAKHQMQFLHSRTTHTGLSGGKGSGKTTIAVIKAIHHMLWFNCKVLYLLPTYDHVKKTAMPEFIKQLNNFNIEHTPNYSDMTIKTPFGEIWLVSYHRPEMIESYTVGYVIIDEIDIPDLATAQKVYELADDRVREPLIDKQGKLHPNRIDFVSTPHGLKFMHYFFVTKDNDDKHLIFGNTADNPYNIGTNYVQRLSSKYTDRMQQAILHGQFVKETEGLVYPHFDPERHVSKKLVFHDDTLHIGVDFNRKNMHAVVGIMESNKLHIVDEVMGLRDTFEMVSEIKKRYPDKTINIYPDSSGKNQSTNASQSDVEILEEEFYVHTRRKNPRIRDRVNKVNIGFYTDAIFINPNTCPNLVKCLTSQGYDSNDKPAKDGTDHANDCLGYLVFSKDLTSDNDYVGAVC